MKLRIPLLLSVLMLALACSSCGGDDEPEAPSLKGTRWSADLSSYACLIVEFTSDSEVVGYHTNAGGDVSGSVAKGRYSFDGSKVTFSDFVIDDLSGSNHFVDGVVEGKSRLVLNYWWEWSGTRHHDSVSLRKL